MQSATFSESMPCRKSFSLFVIQFYQCRKSLMARLKRVEKHSLPQYLLLCPYPPLKSHWKMKTCTTRKHPVGCRSAGLAEGCSCWFAMDGRPSCPFFRLERALP